MEKLPSAPCHGQWHKLMSPQGRLFTSKIFINLWMKKLPHSYGKTSCVQQHWTGCCQISLFKWRIHPPFPCSGPSTGNTLDWITLYIDLTLCWITKILYTVRTEIQLVTASLLNLWGQPRDSFLDEYLELRSQHPSSLKTDVVYPVVRMRDEHKVQHLCGIPTHPKKQFARTCTSGTSCIQSSMLELDHFIIFYTFGLEGLSLFLKVTRSYSTWDTWMESKLPSAMTFSLPIQTGAAVPLMTILQFVGHQACREILPWFPHTWLCKGTEEELRQDSSQGSYPLAHIASQQAPHGTREK